MHDPAQPSRPPYHPPLRKRIAALFGPALAVILMAAAFYVLRYELAHHSWREIAEAIAAVPRSRIALAVGLTALNYLWLSSYDAIALHYLDRRLRPALIVLGAFAGYAMSHNFGWLGGATTRYRLYSAWGLTAIEIVKLVAVLGLTFAIGQCALGGLIFTINPLPLPEKLRLLLTRAHISLESTFWLGPVCLLIVAVYLGACALRRKFSFHRRKMQLPRLRLAVLQLIVPAIDLLLLTSVMYVLLPADIAISYWQFANVAILAIGLGIASNVPGGVGVIEAVVIKLVPDADPVQLIGTLLVFRGVYYLLPLALATSLFAGHEVLTHHESFRSLLAKLRRPKR